MKNKQRRSFCWFAVTGCLRTSSMVSPWESWRWGGYREPATLAMYDPEQWWILLRMWSYHHQLRSCHRHLSYSLLPRSWGVWKIYHFVLFKTISFSQPNGKKVACGAWKTSGVDSNEESRSITEIINHPQYVDGTEVNDISVLKVSGSFNCAQGKIWPACLPSTNVSSFLWLLSSKCLFLV